MSSRIGKARHLGPWFFFSFIMCIAYWRNESYCGVDRKKSPRNTIWKLKTLQRRWTWTGDFKCREVKTGFYRNRSMQTGSSGTLIGWKSGQTTFVPLWDWMEGAWLRTQNRIAQWRNMYRCINILALTIVPPLVFPRCTQWTKYIQKNETQQEICLVLPCGGGIYDTTKQ